MEERTPPQNIEAEKSVLGSILIDNTVMAEIAEMLMPEDFYRASHKLIFEAMLELYKKSDAIDYITLTEVLTNNGKLEDVGGLAYVMALTTLVPTAGNVKYYAEIVANNSTKRGMIQSATEITAMAYEGGEEVDLLLDRAEKSIMEIANRKKQQTFTQVDAVLMDIAKDMEKRKKGGITGIPTGFIDLDKLLTGLHPSEFIILAARPSMGKTALALNIVANVALRSHLKTESEPYSVAFFSLEMSSEQLVNRMLCSEASINGHALATGELNAGDYDRFWSACDILSKAKIFIEDTPGITPLEMRSHARRLKAEKGLDLIVIDYLQLMGTGMGKKNQSENRQQEVSEISRSMKALARELDVPVIALSQLSRSVEQRQVKKPMLSDLRESGSLEQDADVVAFLYRDEYYNRETDKPHVTELLIAKNRSGPVDTVYLHFQSEFTRFGDLSKRPEG